MPLGHFQTGITSRKALAKAGRGLHPDGIRDLAAGLPRLADIPIRLIHGKRDRILPHAARTMRRLNVLWPHAERTELPRAGHFLQEDAPAEIGALLAAFVAAH